MIGKSAKWLVVLGLVFSLSFMTGCGGSENAANNGDSTAGVEKPNGEEQSVKKGLPLTVSAYDNSYSITDFEVDVEEGVTVIKCQGSGFDVIPFRDGGAVVPVWCSIVVDGSEVEYSSASLGGEGTTFYFDSVYEPETVIFYPGDNQSEKTEVAVD